jgi:alpha-1,2-mannosyltransferase
MTQPGLDPEVRADSPNPGNDRRRHAVTVATLVGAAMVAVVLWLRPWQWWMADFAVYRAGGSAVVHGQPLYDVTTSTTPFANMPFTYSPFAGLLFSPLAFLRTGFAQDTEAVVNFLALGAVLWLSLGLAGIRESRHRLALTAAAWIPAAMLTPVVMTIVLGQLNIIMMLLVLADFAPGMPRRWRGIAIGIAAGVKLTPMIFAVYLFAIGRRADALRAAITFLVTVAFSFLLLPGDSRAYWLHGVVFDAERAVVSGKLINHSIPGLFARLAGTAGPPWWSLPIAVAVGTAGLAVAVSVYRQRQPMVALLITAFTGFLVSPISWDHHAVWIVPALVWLASAQWKHGSVLSRVIVVAAITFFTVPVNWLSKQFGGEHWQLTGVGDLFVSVAGYMTVTILTLTLLPVWFPRLAPTSSADEDLHRSPGAQPNSSVA